MGPTQNQGQNTPTRRQPDIEDYIDMVRRYRGWIIGPMFAGIVVATVIAFLWPDTYISTATMRITPQQVSDKLVPVSPSTQMAERLQSMQTEILSRGSLTELIMKPSLDLYKKERLKLPMEDLVLEMKNKHIHISPIVDNSSGRQRSSAFSISFSYTDRYKAKAVVSELVTKFTEQNITFQRGQTSLTASFIGDQMKLAKEKMDDLAQQLTRFKLENAGRLPEQIQANVSAQTSLQMQIMNLGQSLAQAQQEKLITETAFKTLQTKLRNAQSNLEQTVTISQPNTVVRNENLVNLERSINEARGRLASMKRTFGSNHPDVTALSATVDSYEAAKLAILEKQEPVQAQPASITRTEISKETQRQIDEMKGDVDMTQAQLTAKQLRIDEIVRQQELMGKRLADYQKKLEEEPLSTQQYAALQRDFALAKDDYEQQAKRRDTAETARSLEDHRAGEQLEVLDSASLPEMPYEPNRLIWAATGLFGGLAVGLVLAAAKEVKDTSLKNLKDVRSYTNLPVLSSIPLLENALLVRRKRRLVWLGWSSALIVGCILMSGSIYYYWSRV